MKVGVNVCLIPFGTAEATHLSEYIAACHEIFREAGLKTCLHGANTEIEGDWDDVMNALKQCHERIHAMGPPRIHTTVQINTRTDKSESLEDKQKSVEKKLTSS